MNDNAEAVDGTRDRAFILAQLTALRDLPRPLADGEWAYLLDLLHQLGVARH
jgi:hypothetical protein